MLDRGALRALMPSLLLVACVEPETSGNATTDAGTPPPVTTAPTAPPAPEAGPPPPEPDAAPPPAVVVTIRTLGPGDMPVDPHWAVWRDEGGAFQTLKPSSLGIATFTPKTSRYLVAMACADSALSDDTELVVIQATTSAKEHHVSLDAPCYSPLPSNRYTVSGTASNLPGGTTEIRMAGGGSSGDGSVAGGSTSGPYETSSVRQGTHDFVFAAVSNTPAEVLLTKFHFARGVAVNAATTLDVDFTTALDALPRTLSVTGAQLSTNAIVRLAAGGAGPGVTVGHKKPAFDAINGTRTFPFAALPAAALGPNDRYEATVLDVSGIELRQVTRTFRAPDGVTIAIPPSFDVSFGAAAVAPRLRPRMTFAPWPSATGYQMAFAEGTDRGSMRSVRVLVEAAWLGQGASLAVEVPDLGAAPGFDPDWLPASGASVNVRGTAVREASLADGRETARVSKTGDVPTPP